MTTAGRRTRLGATAVVVVLLVLGTLWGQDDDFPFGPLRMFAHANKVDGVVYAPQLVAVDSGGGEHPIEGDLIGLRRAELEGRYHAFRADPSLLAELAQAYEARYQGVDIVEVRLLRHRRDLVDSRVVAETTDVVVAWEEADAT
ncbi:MAG: hypothetical protein ACRD0G_07540 [Acidimicrobiales bacterium]